MFIALNRLFRLFMKFSRMGHLNTPEPEDLETEILIFLLLIGISLLKYLRMTQALQRQY